MKIKKVLSSYELSLLHRYFNAANYLSVGQLYLLDNPLLTRPLEDSDIKSNVNGYWGTVPGQNFIWTHLNRIINRYDLNMIYVSGPSHGGNSQIANTYLEGSYTEIYPEITRDLEGLKKLFRQFSFPGGVSNYSGAEVPGSLHEGIEQGYSLAHAFGAVLDNYDLIAAVCVGDGEAETGTLSASWNINRFINPSKDGTVLPILHLNGYKAENPSIFGRMTNKEVKMYFKGLGWKPIIVEGREEFSMHEKMARAMDECVKEIQKIKDHYGEEYDEYYIPRWPMIVLRTPNGWTGPKLVEEKVIEDTFRAHQIPVRIDSNHPNNLRILETWLRNYHPEKIWNDDGTLKEDLLKVMPNGSKRMGANSVTNGGLLYEELVMPDLKEYIVNSARGDTSLRDSNTLSNYLRDVIKNNPLSFRAFGVDELLFSRLSHIFEVTNRQWVDEIITTDDFLSKDGRVIDSYLSESFCEAALEGYLLSGRQGLFYSSEEHVRIILSMIVGYSKWLNKCKILEWRKDLASLNHLIVTGTWNKYGNDYSNQDPAYLNYLVTNNSDNVKIYLPSDSNSLLCCFDNILETKNNINIVLASKNAQKQWLTFEEAKEQFNMGISKWEFASSDDEKTDLVFASCGSVPTEEMMAAVTLLRKYYPNLKIRVVNVLDLMKLDSRNLSNEEFEKIFTNDKHVIFAFYGYPSLINGLIHDRANNKRFHIHGYQEKTSITTSFGIRVLNELDRYHLVMDALNYVDVEDKDKLIDYCNNMLEKSDKHILKYGIDMDEIINWEPDKTWKDK